MSKFKRWICTRFLPEYCKEKLLAENAALMAANVEQRQEIDRLKAYIAGFENAIRTQRRITIRNEVKP